MRDEARFIGCVWAGPIAKISYLVFFFYVGVAGNTSLVDAGTLLGATAVVTPGSAGLSTLGVLHAGVLVMWYAHIRDLSPTAEAVRVAVCPM